MTKDKRPRDSIDRLPERRDRRHFGSFDLCFDCGLPLFGYVMVNKSPAENPKAVALGVSTGGMHYQGRSWHRECAERRSPRRVDEGSVRGELWTMRMNLEERGDLTRLIDMLGFRDGADVIRWLVRSELARRFRVEKLTRQATAEARARARELQGARSRRPRGAAKK